MTLPSDVLYVIPPYLLNTCLGLDLKHRLATQDEELANSNVISLDSPKYDNKNEAPKIPENQFANDPFINRIIKEKMIYKFSVLGVLGKNPMEPGATSDETLYELWQVFKERILADNDESSRDKASGKSSKFDSNQKIGETFFANELEKVPREYSSYLSYTLKDLILSTNLDIWHTYKATSSFIKFDDKTRFEYNLPISWAPLLANNYLYHLENNYGLQIVNDKGISSIKLSSEKYGSSILEDLKTESRYHNFITDKMVSPHTGIFYYEVEVLQEATAATDYQPLIEINDASISSETSLHLCMGYTKASIVLETPPKPSAAAPASSITVKSRRTYLESIKDTLYRNRRDDIMSGMTEDVEIYLSKRPGHLRGSYVLSFEDLKFHNSIRAAEALQRLAGLNMNRRLSQLSRQSTEELDFGDIDLEVPFNTNISKTKNKKLFKTDVVGYGINFIDKSFFITLNGILLKTIPHGSSNSRFPVDDDIFDDENDNSVYPIVGFEVKDIPEVKKHIAPSTSEIRANFGFKEMKFNINNYVKNFKAQKQRDLYLSQLDKPQDKPSTKIDLMKDGETEPVQKLLVDDQPILHKLIKGYLNHEGYLSTFDAFNNDLKTLKSEVNDESMEDKDDDIKQATRAYDRQLIKHYIFSNQFADLMDLFTSTYAPAIENNIAKDIIFEISLTRYMYLAKKYLEMKLNLNNFEFDFEFKSGQSEDKLFEETYSLGKQLQEDYKDYTVKSNKIKEVSKAVLFLDSQAVRNLLNKYSRHLNELMSEINRQILTSFGFKNVSDIETIINEVHRNIKELSLNKEDKDFMLINYEQDYISL